MGELTRSTSQTDRNALCEGLFTCPGQEQLCYAFPTYAYLLGSQKLRIPHPLQQPVLMLIVLKAENLFHYRCLQWGLAGSCSLPAPSPTLLVPARETLQPRSAITPLCPENISNVGNPVPPPDVSILTSQAGVFLTRQDSTVSPDTINPMQSAGALRAISTPSTSDRAQSCRPEGPALQKSLFWVKPS